MHKNYPHISVNALSTIIGHLQLHEFIYYGFEIKEIIEVFVFFPQFDSLTQLMPFFFTDTGIKHLFLKL